MMMLVHELASRCVNKCDNGWVSWRICTDEWMSEWKKMNEVMIGWLNEERLGERSLIMSYQIDKGICMAIGCNKTDVLFGEKSR